MKKGLKPLVLTLQLPLMGMAQAAPQGALETPEAGDIESGIINIIGWAIDDAPGVNIRSVSLSVDGGPPIEIPYGGMRPDVQRAFPQVEGALRSGFAATLSTQKLGNGEHHIQVRITSENGEQMLIDRTFYVSNPPNREGQWWTDVDLSQAIPRVEGNHLVLDNVIVNGQTYNGVKLAFDRRTNGFQMASWVSDYDHDGYPDDDHPYRQSEPTASASVYEGYRDPETRWVSDGTNPTPPPASGYPEPHDYPDDDWRDDPDDWWIDDAPPTTGSTAAPGGYRDYDTRYTDYNDPNTRYTDYNDPYTRYTDYNDPDTRYTDYNDPDTRYTDYNDPDTRYSDYYDPDSYYRGTVPPGSS